MPIKVAIVEDEPETCERLESIVNSDDELFCCGTFKDADSFIKKFKHLDVDVVLMDIGLPGTTGIECVGQLKPVKEAVQFIMCTTYMDNEKIFAAITQGATGYLVKTEPKEKIVAAIKDINSGGVPMTSQIARKALQFFRSDHKNEQLFNKLSPQEKRTLELLSEGNPYKITADKMGLTTHTINSYVKKIYEKLDVHSLPEALRKLKQHTTNP